ncbi:hypothetical protein AC578_1130 [Pseudocercospora eumusae]|uniref:Zinc/iron permease n=1 Tax=Pseudocercospora eumusae TaxID=321146 RepID=A0A139HJT3_9PEZI|nr:hypothetical protein AC578_1130 [Pseudocercospora eumusae]
MDNSITNMGISNDGRGWIMTGLSGIACMFGASFICVDIIVRQFPGKAAWKIQNSDAFLSISLSLSFGVMLFSALYSMLPSAKSSLVRGGYDAKTAAWILIACFIGGVAGIQIISRILHRFIPHNVVDCEHKHDDEEAHKEAEHDHQTNRHDHHHHTNPQPPRRISTKRQNSRQASTRPQIQHTPSSHRSSYFSNQSHSHHSTIEPEHNDRTSERPPETIERRTTLQSRIKEGVSKLTTGKDPSCTCDGPCYGYSDICQSDCFKSVNGRGGFKAPKPTSGAQRPAATKSVTATESTPLLAEIVEEPVARPHTQAAAEGAADTNVEDASDDSFGSMHKTHSHHSEDSHHVDEEDPDHHHHHHHHVPTNAFLNIGLQTSIAIALHKLPEGFITYATNHANPKLGVSVFLALFIHNITEGFAMALPLYLAINNRLKAMIVSFALGSLSQPLGAGVAALWFKAAGKSGWEPSEAVYGGMFAVTAGILASVALQLFAESLDLTHSKHLCMIGAFAGMSILGISSALTA